MESGVVDRQVQNLIGKTRKGILGIFVAFDGPARRRKTPWDGIRPLRSGIIPRRIQINRVAGLMKAVYCDADRIIQSGISPGRSGTQREPPRLPDCICNVNRVLNDCEPGTVVFVEACKLIEGKTAVTLYKLPGVDDLVARWGCSCKARERKLACPHIPVGSAILHLV